MTYVIENDNLSDLLVGLSNFQDKIALFLSHHPAYEYEYDIYKEEDKWIIEMNVDKDGDK